MLMDKLDGVIYFRNKFDKTRTNLRVKNGLEEKKIVKNTGRIRGTIARRIRTEILDKLFKDACGTGNWRRGKTTRVSLF